jgi:plastocyanin
MGRLRLALGGALVVVALAPPVGARAATVPVEVEFAAFGPSQVEVLTGDTVSWENVGGRQHTVTADDGSFDSGPLDPDTTFARDFAVAGTYAYHCTIHPSMTGAVVVSAVTLDPLPSTAVPSGAPVDFAGRTADPGQPVLVQRALPDGGFQTVGTASPAADGTWSTQVAAQASGDYRAADGAGASPSRHLVVSDRKVLVRAVRGGLAVTVVPPLPYARVLLELRLRERFGWWPTLRARLDYVSEAVFHLRRARVEARAVLVDRDGWTPLATSAAVLLGRGR